MRCHAQHDLHMVTLVGFAARHRIVMHSMTCVWPKAFFTVTWGIAPGASGKRRDWLKAIFITRSSGRSAKTDVWRLRLQAYPHFQSGRTTGFHAVSFSAFSNRQTDTSPRKFKFGFPSVITLICGSLFFGFSFSVRSNASTRLCAGLELGKRLDAQELTINFFRERSC